MELYAHPTSASKQATEFEMNWQLDLMAVQAYKLAGLGPELLHFL